MTNQPATIEQANLLAYFSVPVLAIYAGAQAAISLLLGAHQSALKLVLEPHLLLIGFVLHVQWRKVDRIYRDCESPRPRWMSACDCLSFVITFWALATLGEAFLRSAKLI